MLKKIRYKIVFNRSRRLNKRGEGLLEIECSQDKRRLYLSTHTYLKPGYFINGSVCGIDNADGLNYALYVMIQDVERVELEFIRQGKDVNLMVLKDAVKSHISPSATLESFGISVVQDSERTELTKANYKTLFNNLERFRQNIYITDIDYQFVVSYDKFLRDSHISHNTRISRLRLLRAIVNEAIKRDIITTNPFNRFRIQQMVSKKGYVHKDQLRRLESMTLSGKEDIARDAFLIGCYTGLRFSDIKSLRNEHIANGWIKKRMQKTKFYVEIPTKAMFDGKMQSLIDKYGGDIERITKKIGNNSSINQLLKPIFERCGIEPGITFHSSRHTCATMLTQAGVDLQTIQKILGHTKIATTQIYAEVDKSKIIKDLKQSNKHK